MQTLNWTLELQFKDIKEMFDPLIERIIKLIDSQLRSSTKKCSALLLVGGFSESSYLESEIRKAFSTKVGVISVPPQPVIAIVKGGMNVFFSF